MPVICESNFIKVGIIPDRIAGAMPTNTNARYCPQRSLCRKHAARHHCLNCWSAFIDRSKSIREAVNTILKARITSNNGRSSRLAAQLFLLLVLFLFLPLLLFLLPCTFPLFPPIIAAVNRKKLSASGPSLLFVTNRQSPLRFYLWPRGYHRSRMRHLRPERVFKFGSINFKLLVQTRKTFVHLDHVLLRNILEVFTDVSLDFWHPSLVERFLDAVIRTAAAIQGAFLCTAPGSRLVVVRLDTQATKMPFATATFQRVTTFEVVERRIAVRASDDHDVLQVSRVLVDRRPAERQVHLHFRRSYLPMHLRFRLVAPPGLLHQLPGFLPLSLCLCLFTFPPRGLGFPLAAVFLPRLAIAPGLKQGREPPRRVKHAHGRAETGA